jgi:peroxiredoxin Q/BCP
MAKGRNVGFLSAALMVASIAVAHSAGAQAATPPAGPQVGDVAPAFTLPGATRYGVLRDPVSLADYKGKVVVLAFFFKARTRG